MRLHVTEGDYVYYDNMGTYGTRFGLEDLGATLADLDAAYPAAKANDRSKAQELERVGALKAVEGKPSFNCATAHRPVEEAICTSAELAKLD